MKKFFKKNNKAYPAKLKRSSGFTLIETMISLSLFLIIIMAGMSALLNANALYQKSQNMRSIIDSLSFMIEDMSRNLREGYHYRCITSDSDLASGVIGTPLSGQNCGGIAFEPPTGNPASPVDQVVYLIGTRTISGAIIHGIFKSVNGGTDWFALNSEEITDLIAASSFSILGAEPPTPGVSGTDDKQQPFVIIKLIGTITYQGNKTPFYLQTSASQRYLDVPLGT